MNRRDFLHLSLALGCTSAMVASCSHRKKIKGGILGSSAHIGHLMRDGKIPPAPAPGEKKKVVIVGAGVSGLSAARYLQKKGIDDVVVFDLEAKAGGNAAYGQNQVSAFPLGAHYIPIPNNDLDDLQSFLSDIGVITGFTSNGLPVYNEYHLCFDPEERLYINGKWQEGLVPHFGLAEKDNLQVKQFLDRMDEYRNLKGADGQFAFSIPVSTSSNDEQFTRLDELTMKEWMMREGFSSEFLHGYVNYCTRDDFGLAHDKCSAWAGIHYYASRKGKGDNAEHSDVLTWPQGNGYLVEQLCVEIQDKIRTGCLVTKVHQGEGVVIVDVFDIKSGKSSAIEAEQCILAVPQFVASRLLADTDRQLIVDQHFDYTPWMVANLLVKPLTERSGAPLSWDNVLFGSQSLGYVDATHQLVQQHVPLKNLTYYLPLTEGPAKQARRNVQHRTFEEWTDIILNDLQKVHPDVREKVEEINIMLWGHAMVQPRPGFIHGKARQSMKKSIGGRIHFAHTDLGGISIFEEGFYQGIEAAARVMKIFSL